MTTPGDPLRKAADSMDALATQVAKLAERVAVLEAALPVQPTPEPPGDVTTPPDTGTLPVRVARGPIKNESAENFIIDRPTRDGKATAAVWLDEYPRDRQLVPRTLRNFEICNFGPLKENGRWEHAIYANNCALTIDYGHIYAPTHHEPLGRTHAMYLNGSSLNATVLVIGKPSDEHPHTISINVAKGDGVDNGPQPIHIDVLLVYGGWRLVIEADPGTVSKLTVGKMIVVNPVTADGLWEGIEVEGCEVAIGDYTVIDTAGRWKSGAMLKAKRCAGEVKRARVYTANPMLMMGDLIRGVPHTLARIEPLPTTPAPDWMLDNFAALVKHYGGAG